MSYKKIFSESLLLNLNEAVSNPEIVVEKIKKVKQKSSGIIIFQAKTKDDKFISIDVYQLDKKLKKRHIMTIHNVFSQDIIIGKNSIIEASFELAERFSSLFRKTNITVKNSQFYFTYHSNAKGYNLYSGRWEKFI
jgi:hypothetical protein